MKNIEWWRGTAQHMWRTFFALLRESPEWESLSDVNKRTFAICHHIYSSKFVSSDQDILKMYFTSKWGDDLYAVEDYSLRHNVPTKVIWMVVRRANKLVMEEIGLLERKDGSDNGKEDAYS